MVFFVFKQKTAYEMRIRDWSSDVCSSDLPGTPDRLRYNYWMHYAEGSLMPLLVMKLLLSRVEPGTPALLRPLARAIVGGVYKGFLDPNLKTHLDYVDDEIGRASWRERVWQ